MNIKQRALFRKGLILSLCNYRRNKGKEKALELEAVQSKNELCQHLSYILVRVFRKNKTAAK